jgi:Domain of unknown function (DUF5666)
MNNDRYISEVSDNRNTSVTQAPSSSGSDKRGRRRGVRVTTAAIAAAVGMALGSGLLADTVEAGAATTSSTTPPSSGGMPGGCTPPSAVGTVKSVGSDSFVVSTSQGSAVTVDVAASTRYMDQGVTDASLANVTVGEHVAIVGSTQDGAVTATNVMIGGPPSGGGRGPGPGPGSHSGTPPKGSTPPKGATGPA